MITKTERFIKGHWGKLMLYSLMLAILYMGYGCTAYHQVSMDKPDFMANSQIQASLPEYTIYVHDGEAIYQMENAQVVNGRDIQGTLVAANYDEPKTDWKRLERKQWWKNHRYDIHVYTNGSLNATASASATPSLLNERVVLSDQMIQEIKVMAYDRKTGATDAIVAVVVVVGLIVVVWLLLMNVDNGGGGGGGSNSGGGSESGGGGSDSD